MSLTRLALASFVLSAVACRNGPSSTPQPGGPLGETQGQAAAEQTSPGGLPKEGVYQLRSTDLRCVAAPCPYYEALDVAAPGGEPIKFHGVELSALELTPQGREKLEARLAKGGIRAAGRFELQKDAGPAGDALIFRVKELRD
jgi:hypothetical protein